MSNRPPTIQHFGLLTQRTIAKLLTPRILAGFKLHCRALLNYFKGRAKGLTYNSNKVFIPHLLDGNVVDKP